MTIRAKTDLLKLARIKNGLSIRQLGEKAGINFVTVSKVENGKTSPNPSTVKKICEALGIAFEEIFIMEVK